MRKCLWMKCKEFKWIKYHGILYRKKMRRHTSGLLSVWIAPFFTCSGRFRGGSQGSVEPPPPVDSWKILDKFDKFGISYLPIIFTLRTFYLILLFNKSILLPLNMYKIVGSVANIVDPDQMPQNVASDLGLHCLLRPVCLNKYYKHIVCIVCSKKLCFVKRPLENYETYYTYLH